MLMQPPAAAAAPAEEPLGASPDPIDRRAPVAPPTRKPPSLQPIRWLLFLYLLLWIFEGALRKWIVPSLANPLLVIRDPVLLLIYALAIVRGVFPKGVMTAWIIILGAVAFAVSFASTDLPLFVQLYGLRADYLHLPLIFLAPKLLDRDSVRFAGKWILLIGLPMSLLVALQFRAPPGSKFNVGAGGEGTMLEAAFGHIRPSGTFSFTNGLTFFTSMMIAYFLHHLLEKKIYPRWLWLGAAPALLVLVALSGSRAIVGLSGLIMTTMLAICFLKPRYSQSALKFVALGAVAFIALGSFAIFRDGLEVFSARFGDSQNVQTGFFGRFIDSFASPYAVLKEVPLGGVGLGMGTNVGAALLVGKRHFLIAEGEWPRILMESGGLVGTAFILLRASIVACMGLASLRSLLRDANTLPLLLFAGGFTEVLQGQWSQPTGLGFAVIVGGMCLAACRMPALGPEEANPAAAPRPSVPVRQPIKPVEKPTEAPDPTAPVRRGRSLYAERLHGTKEEETPP